MKVMAGRDYLKSDEIRIDHNLIQRPSNLANKLDYIIRIPYVYHFINHGLGSIAKRTIKKAIKKYNIDLVITGAPMDLTKKDVAPAKLVQFVHDTMPLDMLETPADNQTPERFAKQFFSAACESDMVLTNSIDTLNKVHEVSPSTPAKVLYGIASNKADKLKDDSYLIRKSLKKDNYLVFVSVIEKRKNILSLIDAYLKVRTKIKMPLVRVGGKGFGYEEIIQYYKELPKDIQEDILFTGFVSESDKYALPNNARAFVFPSLYEGIGLPIIEAFGSNLPVLTSNRGALPEAGGKAAYYIEDPYDTDEIAAGIVKIATDNELRAELRSHMKTQSEKFTPNKFNERFKEAITSLEA
jgi:glycosyltransferase involved in cell wall biosynthesis